MVGRYLPEESLKKEWSDSHKVRGIVVYVSMQSYKLNKKGANNCHKVIEKLEKKSEKSNEMFTQDVELYGKLTFKFGTEHSF